MAGSFKLESLFDAARRQVIYTIGLMNTLSRRQFARAIAATAATTLASASLPRIALAQMSNATLLRFPADFKWGCATASYQIEGGCQRRRAGAVGLGHFLAHAGQDL